MSMEIFSVMVSHAAKPTDITPYIQLLTRVQHGIQDLLAPILWSCKVRVFRRVDPTGEEWLDVRGEEGAQCSMIPKLERSLGSAWTDLDIEGALAQKRIRHSLVLLTELQAKRQWNASEFLGVVERDALARSGRRMGDDQGRLKILTPDGLCSSMLLPNRRFSSLRAEAVGLQFCPLKVGIDVAQVQLTKTAHRLVMSRSRRIELHWSGTTSERVADELFQKAKGQQWVWARCRVVDNRDGVAKTLLLESMHET